jgi:cytochrome c5
VRLSSTLVFASLGLALAGCNTPSKTAPPQQVASAAGGPVAIVAAPGAAQAAADNKGPGNPDQTICKREEVTGSRLAGARECHTRAEWAQIKATGMDKLQMLGAPGPTPTQTASQAGN